MYLLGVYVYVTEYDVEIANRFSFLYCHKVPHLTSCAVTWTANKYIKILKIFQ